MPKVTRSRTTHRWSPIAQEHELRARKFKTNRCAVTHWSDVYMDSIAHDGSILVKTQRRQAFAVRKIVEAGKTLGWSQFEDVVVGVLAGRKHPEDQLAREEKASRREDIRQLKLKIERLENQVSDLHAKGSTHQQPPTMPMEIDGPEDQMPEVKIKAKVIQPSSANASVPEFKKAEDKGMEKAVDQNPAKASVPEEALSSQSKAITSQGKNGGNMVVNHGQPEGSSSQKTVDDIMNEVTEYIVKWSNDFPQKAITAEPEQLPNGSKVLLDGARQASQADGKPVQVHLALQVMVDGLEELVHLKPPMRDAFADLAKSAGNLVSLPLEQKSADKSFADCLNGVLTRLAGRPIIKREGVLKQSVENVVHDIMHKLCDLFPDETFDESVFTKLFARALQAVMAQYAQHVRAHFPGLINTDQSLDHIPTTSDYERYFRSG